MKRLRRQFILRLLAAMLLFAASRRALSNPNGMTVVSGTAAPPVPNGSQYNITADNNAVLSWQSFDIAAGETTIFHQPSSSSIVWNRINGPMSQINGTLQANGIVVLLNSSGFYFGPNSFVSAAGLVVSTANVTPPQNGGGSWEFNGPPPLKSISNYGQIQVGQNGSAFLIADDVENHGTISAPGGTVGLASGQTVLLSERPDGRGMSMAVTLPQNSVNNYGTLLADAGTIALNAQVVNQNGFVQANAVQNQNGVIEFVASDTVNLGAGSQTVADGGRISASAPTVNQNGLVQANSTLNEIGNIQLDAGDTLNLNANSQTTAAGGCVTLSAVNNLNANAGSQITAAGGNISASAPEINLSGTIQADSVQNQNGTIDLVAGDTLNLGATSHIYARGDGSAGGSAGGSVTLQAANNFSDTAGSQIATTGGSQGGNGGNVEINAPNQTLNSTVDAGAQAGWNNGQVFLFSMANIILGFTTGVLPDNNGVINETAGSGTSYVNVNNAFQNITGDILVETSGNISLNPNTSWDLTSSTGGKTGGQLTLEAGGDILFGNNSKITDANDWSVALKAGYSFASGAVQLGAGNIYLNNNSGGETGGGSIQTARGNIQLFAGDNIFIGGKFVRTTAGGNIVATALAGSVDTGAYAHGYQFLTSAPYVKIDSQNGTGGISTEAGGNVTITAGQDIISYLPNTSASGDAGSGAFGPQQAGSVTLVAGGNVMGHYVVADGIGEIDAGVLMNNGVPVTDAGGHYVLNPVSGGSAGTADYKLALSLIDSAPISAAGASPVVYGGWTVNAARDIYLQEVRNPDGIFNGVSPSSTAYHLFNYAPGDYVHLTAGDAVMLGDSSTALPRGDIDIPFIYPSILNVSAGAGGVTLLGDISPYNELILFPSALGSLDISTTGGGSLSGTAAGGIFELIVSDSGQSQYNDPTADLFGLNDHAATPVHQDSPTLVALNISGSLDNVLLGAPEAATINVVGDMINSRFQGQNLHANDVTGINVGEAAKLNLESSGLLNPASDASLYVGGNILNRAEFTTINFNDVLAANPDAAPPDLSLMVYGDTALARHLFYDTVTGKLTFQGLLTDAILGELADMAVQVYQNGVAQFNPDGSPVTQQVNVLDPNVPTGTLGPNALALQAEYAALGPIPTTLDNGYLIGGGGQFNFNAANMDLGFTLGIVSGGPEFNYSLAKNSLPGAAVNVNLTGNLDMFSTTISALAGGGVSVAAGGYINVGSSVFVGNDANPRGIYTSLQSDVAVIAGGDINLNGSRIAAYDGGNVLVESLHGNIDAGTGANGKVVVNEFYVQDGQVVNPSTLVPGSGILATTFPSPGDNALGNILVETPEGNITASRGGIIQVALNNVNNDTATVILEAGSRDAQGNIVAVGNIDASGSGVIGSNVKLDATGDIEGFVFGRAGISIIAQQNVNVTALSAGNVSVSSASGSVSGNIIGGSVSASGASIDATVLSQNASVNGQSGGDTFAQGTAANATSQAASGEDANKSAATTSDQGADDDLKKKGKQIALAQKVSRVTVLLPARK